MFCANIDSNRSDDTVFNKEVLDSLYEDLFFKSPMNCENENGYSYCIKARSSH